MKKSENLSKTYRGYADIPTQRFYDIADGDLGWFFKDYEGEGIEFSEETKEDLTKKFHAGFNESDYQNLEMILLFSFSFFLIDFFFISGDFE